MMEDAAADDVAVALLPWRRMASAVALLVDQEEGAVEAGAVGQEAGRRALRQEVGGAASCCITIMAGRLLPPGAPRRLPSPPVLGAKAEEEAPPG